MEESLENVAVQVHKFYSTEACQQKISELKMLMQLELLMQVDSSSQQKNLEKYQKELKVKMMELLGLFGRTATAATAAVSSVSATSSKAYEQVDMLPGASASMISEI